VLSKETFPVVIIVLVKCLYMFAKNHGLYVYESLFKIHVRLHNECSLTFQFNVPAEVRIVRIYARCFDIRKTERYVCIDCNSSYF